MLGRNSQPGSPPSDPSVLGARRRENRARSRIEYARSATVLTARPRFLLVELTRMCNLSCEMCRPPSYNRTAGSLQADLFERVADELMPYAEIVDLRGWGESLILPGFEDRLAQTLKTGTTVRIVTNLSFRRDAALDSLAQAGAYICISLDSANPKMLRRLRRGARLDLIERNLKRLTETYAEHGRGDRLCLYVTCQAPNLDSLGDIVDFAARCGVRDVRFAPVTVAPGSELELPQDRAQLRAAFNEVEARAMRQNVRASVTASPFDHPHAKPNESACLHPWTHCYVATDGRVGFCDHLIGPDGDPYVLGNLTTTPFEEIWNGPAWVALRQTHVTTRDVSAPHFGECAWCYRNRYLDSENLLEPALECGRKTISELAWL